MSPRRANRPRPRLLTETAIEGLQAIAITIFLGLALMGLALLDL